MDSRRQDDRPGAARTYAGRRSLWWIVPALLAPAALAVWLGVVLAPREKARSIERWRDQLSAMADDRSSAVERWVGERFGDAAYLAATPSVAAAVSEPALGPASRTGGDERSRTESNVKLIAVQTDYLSVVVLTADGRRVAGFDEVQGIDSTDRDIARQCVSAGHALVDSHLRGGTTPVVRFVAPVVGRASGPAIGAVILTADPESWLFPFLRHQAVLSDTAETVLAQREVDEVVFLTPLRHGAAKPLTFRRPLSTPGFAAAAAFAGREEFTEYVDYRGVPVFATARRIRGTPWALVAKVDRDEALAGYRRWLAGALAAFAAALLAAGGLGYGLMHRYRSVVREVSAVNERRLAELVNEASNAVFVLSAEGKVLQANRRAEERYGYSLEELLRMTTADLRAPGAREGARAALQQAIEGGPVLVETFHQRRDGTTFPVEVSIHHADVRDERVLLEAVRDMTAQRAAEARIAHLNRLLRTISEINQLVVRERDRDRMLEEACRILVEHGGFRMVWVGLADEASGAVVPAAWAGHEDGYLGSVTIRFDDTPFGKGPTGTAIRDGRAVVINDWEADERVAPWREEARRRGYRASAMFPLSVGGTVTGALSVYGAEPGVFDAEVTNLLAELAGDISLALGAMATEAKRQVAERSLADSESRFRTMFERTPLGYQSLDGEGRFLDVNPAWLTMLGYEREDVVGRWFGDFLAPEYVERFRVNFPGFRAAGEIHGIEFELVRKDGSTIMASFDGRVGYDEDGRFKQTHCLLADITERRRAEEEIRRLNAELEERVRERTAQLEAVNTELEAFSYSVSHDLRAPLRAIDGFSRMVVEDNADRLGDQGKRQLQVIRDSTQKMGRLIDDLLSFSRVGRAELNRARVAMVPLVHSVFLEIVRVPAERERIALAVGELPDAWGDPALIRQVWVNLLSNAVKFSRPRPRAEIKVSASARDGGIVYRVADNGVGFDMRYVEKLFGTFQRLHSTDEFEGTGIGLALVKRIVRRHGGEVSAEGAVDGGATFSFALPEEGNHEQR